MGERDETSAGAAKLSPTIRAYMLFSTIVGVIGLFNIVSHAQTVLDISEAFQRLNEWWRYLIKWPFELLPWRLSPLAQDVLVIASVTIAAARVWTKKARRQGVLGFVLSEARKPDQGISGDFFGADLAGVWMIGLVSFGGLISVPTLFFFVHSLASGQAANAVLIAPIVISNIAFWKLVYDALRWTERFNRLLLLIAAPTIFLAALGAGTITLLIFARMYVLRSAGLLALLLVANWACVTFIEPGRPLLSDLPRPPGSGPAAWEQTEGSSPPSASSLAFQDAELRPIL